MRNPNSSSLISFPLLLVLWSWLIDKNVQEVVEISTKNVGVIVVQNISRTQVHRSSIKENPDLVKMKNLHHQSRGASASVGAKEVSGAANQLLKILKRRDSLKWRTTFVLFRNEQVDFQHKIRAYLEMARFGRTREGNEGNVVPAKDMNEILQFWLHEHNRKRNSSELMKREQQDSMCDYIHC